MNGEAQSRDANRAAPGNVAGSYPLKFAGPVIDEATIEGVAEVLRSGHITSGPWVERFEALPMARRNRILGRLE